MVLKPILFLCTLRLLACRRRPSAFVLPQNAAIFRVARNGLHAVTVQMRSERTKKHPSPF
ncbi:hypothetical protein NBRC111894_3216 [Sporolactobacillus inulinus]|uniref:Uncharacterized protein n=1 Tax=Sporolactobacillus inulinus TaxID=2078 RepID=A0A4Y1ZEQ8_9BACL|nr:hypothetical protein NBRC111894_3216 [Sporolactobacillus inulinus]